MIHHVTPATIFASNTLPSFDWKQIIDAETTDALKTIQPVAISENEPGIKLESCVLLPPFLANKIVYFPPVSAIELAIGVRDLIKEECLKN